MGKFVPFKKKGSVEAEGSEADMAEDKAEGNPFAKKAKGKGKKKKKAKKVGRSSFASEIFGK